LLRDSTLTVTGMTVDGQGLAVADGAVVLADTKVPLAEAGSVAKTLADAGIEVAYLAAKETATGLTSSALTVSRRQETPAGLQVTVNLVLGQVVASIDGSAVSNEPVAIGNDVTPPASEQPAAPADTTAAATSGPADPTFGADGLTLSSDPASDVAAPSAPSSFGVAGPSRLAPGPIPESATTAVSEAAAPTAPTPATATLATVRRKPWSFDTRSGYLVMAAGVAAGVALQLILGRRRRGWTS
jgi:hypothetical protein